MNPSPPHTRMLTTLRDGITPTRLEECSVSPSELFSYASEYATTPAAKAIGAQYPTFRDVAKRFKVTYDQIEQTCEDWDHRQGYMQPAIGGQCGSGIFTYSSRGEHLVEAYH